MSHDLRNFVGAHSAEDFIGRHDELERFGRLVASGIAGSPQVMAVRGRARIGKSAFLNEALAGLAERGAEVIPIYLDLRELMRDGGDLGGAEASDFSSRFWTHCIRSLVRQAYSFENGISPFAPQVAGADAKGLAAMCHAIGLGEWRAIVCDGVGIDAENATACWRGILGHRVAFGAAPYVFAVDGLSLAQRSSQNEQAIAGLLSSTREGIAAILFESPSWMGSQFPDSIADISLGGLGSAGSRQLLLRLAPSAATLPAPELQEALLDRLGGNPQLIADWFALWSERAGSHASEARRVWEGYLDLLARGPVSMRWRGEFEAAVPASVRGSVSEWFLGTSNDSVATGNWTDAEFAARNPVTEFEAASILGRLEACGFVRRAGSGFEPALATATRDWFDLEARDAEPGMGRNRSGAAGARVELLEKLLAGRASNAGSVESGKGSAAEEILSHFLLQRIPMALFRYDQYYEALGQVSPEKREQEILQASSVVRVPEVIGVVPVATQTANRIGSSPGIRVHYARGFREGVYSPSQEETWLAGDATHLPTLTSDEVRVFLDAAAEVEAGLGPGRYVRWILTGGSVSPEAIEILVRERIYCTGPEQLEILRRFVDRAAPIETKPEVEKAEHSGDAPGAFPTRTPIIPIGNLADGDNGVTRLSILAQDQNEVIAATMAEKVAFRCGFDEEDAGRIKIAVLEGCLNAIEHSLNREKEVRIALIEHPDQLEILIENEGKVFDPYAVGDPNPIAKLKSADKRGWGIKLMREFMDEVNYEPTRTGMQLRLIKRKPAKEDMQGVGPERQQKLIRRS